MDKLIAFLRGLQDTGTHYSLGYHAVPGTTPTAITVHVTPWAGELWEVEFFGDGEVEIERFVSTDGDGDATVEELLAELLEKR